MNKPTRPPPYDVAILAPFSVKRAEGGDAEGDWIVDGYAYMREFSGDGVLIEPSALEEATPEWMENPAITLNHDLSVRQVVGRALAATMDSVGYFVRAMISKAERDVWTKITEEIIRNYSIHVRILEANWDEELGVARATKVKIVEVALTSFPVDPGASFAIARESPFAVGREAIREMLNPKPPAEATKPVVKQEAALAGTAPAEEVIGLLAQSTLACAEVARTFAAASVPGLVRAEKRP